MTKPQRGKRGKPYGTRAALLALALSGTISGWAIMAGGTANSTPTATNAIVEIMAPASSGASPTLLSPIPTLVPPPSAGTATALAQPSSLKPIPNVTQATTARPVVRSRSSR